MNVASILADETYPALKQYILEHTGLSYYSDKDEDLASRIARRITARDASSCAVYRVMLDQPEGGRQEMEALIGELTIGETYFFRHREHFDLLRDIALPDLLQRNRVTASLRIWSAGCATGAEPYSIGLLLQLELLGRIPGWDISIVATDLNTEFLAQAREALYAEWAFREMPDAIRMRCFQKEGNRWRLRPQYREWVRFVHHNLAGSLLAPGSPGTSYDLVVCRNVLIYFNRDLVERSAARFYEALAPGGWLLVGHAEPNAEIFKSFRAICTSEGTLYQKPAALHDVPVAPPFEWRPLPVSPAGKYRAAAPRPVDRLPPVSPPSAGQATLDEARVLADRGEGEAAAALCRKLIEANALDPAVHFTLGLALEHSGHLNQAQDAFRRAIYLDRSFALAHYHLGACLQNTRNMTRASKAFENVLQLLAAEPAEEILPHGDGITVTELGDLARMHLQVMNGR